jgi:hypothetical protein
MTHPMGTVGFLFGPRPVGRLDDGRAMLSPVVQ